MATTTLKEDMLQVSLHTSQMTMSMQRCLVSLPTELWMHLRSTAIIRAIGLRNRSSQTKLRTRVASVILRCLSTFSKARNSSPCTSSQDCTVCGTTKATYLLSTASSLLQLCSRSVSQTPSGCDVGSVPWGGRARTQF